MNTHVNPIFQNVLERFEEQIDASFDHAERRLARLLAAKDAEITKKNEEISRLSNSIIMLGKEIDRLHQLLSVKCEDHV